MPEPPATVRPLTTWFEPLPLVDRRLDCLAPPVPGPLSSRPRRRRCRRDEAHRYRRRRAPRPSRGDARHQGLRPCADRRATRVRPGARRPRRRVGRARRQRLRHARVPHAVRQGDGGHRVEPVQRLGRQRPRGRHRDDRHGRSDAVLDRPRRELHPASRGGHTASGAGPCVLPGRPGDDDQPGLPPRPRGWGRRPRRAVQLGPAACRDRVAPGIRGRRADGRHGTLAPREPRRPIRRGARSRPGDDDRPAADRRHRHRGRRPDHPRRFADVRRRSRPVPEPIRGARDPARCAGRLRPGDRADR